jgi:hypothetical protein
LARLSLPKLDLGDADARIKHAMPRSARRHIFDMAETLMKMLFFPIIALALGAGHAAAQDAINMDGHDRVFPARA